jgi:coenzyme F420-0:L-glutamate ligase / coenzyme F420-1:gamma-L-glutamate ligase
MELIPIRTPVVHAGDDLSAILKSCVQIHDGDIVVLSSKVVATTEGAAIDLTQLNVSAEATEWCKKTGRSPAFMQAVLNETGRMHGSVLGHTKGVLLTELRPDSLSTGVLLVPNAGLDESNIGDGYAIGWPLDPVASLKRLQKGLNRNSGVIMSDSCVHLRRSGVVAFALAACGIDPLKSEIGKEDLFGRAMTITMEAVADQLATAANMMMGNRAQSTPAVIIREHGIPMSDFCGWVEGIEPEDDLFSSLL